MRNLNAIEMLSVWEQCLNQSLLQKALIFLVAVFPEMHPETLATLTIGQRDRRLLQLRERLFGQQLLTTAVCPKCKERIEWQSSITDYLMPCDEENETTAENEFEAEDYFFRFRLPNSLDLAAVIDCENTQTAQQLLLFRCLLQIEYSGSSCSVDQLPEPIIGKLNQQIEALDPQAVIRINLSCPECSHHWDVLFDIASFLWIEINDWAEHMLQTVHKLAKAYGWSEREVLNLSPVRRQLYLGMLGA